MAKRDYLVLALFLTITSASIFNQETSDSDISVAHVYADAGNNVSLGCTPQSLSSSSDLGYSSPLNDQLSLSWIRQGKALQHSRVDRDGTLLLAKVDRNDAGLYICQAEELYTSSEEMEPRIVAQVQLHIKTTPPPPVSVTVYPSSVLALVMWKFNGTGGYAISHVSVVYQKLTDDPDDPAWHRTFPEHVGPELTQLEIYKLEPNTTYRVRVWATNKLGPGDYTEQLATTKPAYYIGGGPAESHHLHSKVHHGVDTRPWVVAVSVVFLSFGVAIVALLLVLFQTRCWRSRRQITCNSPEDLELVPNIILNPNYDGNDTRYQASVGRDYPDENCNDRQALLRLNNNHVVRPVNL